MFCIIDHIEYLIQRHECVVIPNWGAFIVHTQQSSFDADNERITVPCRSLGFNPALTYNDGMLVSSIMRKEGVSYEKANYELFLSQLILAKEGMGDSPVKFTIDILGKRS